LWPLYYAIAVVVAASRVHVRIHHASDVIGGAAIGILLGELTRLLVPVGTRDTTDLLPETASESAKQRER
jgi:undecaprenyl-diphosphatase